MNPILTIALSTFLLLCTQTLLHTQSDCYKLLIDQGKKALLVPDYEEATSSFTSIINNCKPLHDSLINSALNYLELTQFRRTEELKMIRDDAVESRRIAIERLHQLKIETREKEIATLESSARNLAFLSRNMPPDTLRLLTAYHSRKLSEIIQKPSKATNTAFIEAVKATNLLHGPRNGTNIRDIGFTKSNGLIIAIDSTIYLITPDRNINKVTPDAPIRTVSAYSEGFIGCDILGECIYYDPDLTRGMTLQGKVDQFTELSSFSEDHTIVALGDTNVVRFWNEKGVRISPSARHISKILAIKDTESEAQYATRSQDGQIKIWDQGGVQLNHVGERSFIYDMTFSADERFVVGAVANGKILIRAIQGGNAIDIDAHEGGVFYVKSHPTTEKILSAGSDNAVRIWNMQGMLEFEVELDHSIQMVSFYPDTSDFLVVSGSQCRRYDINGNLKMTINHDKFITMMIMSSYQNHLVTIDADGQLALWDEDGEIVLNLSFEGRQVKDLVLSPDHTYVAACTWANEVVAFPIPEFVYQSLLSLDSVNQPRFMERYNIEIPVVSDEITKYLDDGKY